MKPPLSGLSEMLLITFILSLWFTQLTCSGSADVAQLKAQCSTSNVCNKYDVNEETNFTLYWFDKSLEQCLLLGRKCVQPNVNNTFKSMKACYAACKDGARFDHDHKVTECGSDGKPCEQDIPPNSNTTSKSVSPVIAIGCAVGGIALVAIIVAGAYAVKRRKKVQKRRYVEDMLHMWSSNSDDSYDSYDDNPEDNNLFDRLERNW